MAEQAIAHGLDQCLRRLIVENTGKVLGNAAEKRYGDESDGEYPEVFAEIGKTAKAFSEVHGPGRELRFQSHNAVVNSNADYLRSDHVGQRYKCRGGNGQ